MTDKQRWLYFRTWQRAYKANWLREAGCIVRLVGRSGPVLDQVEDIACEFARRTGGKVDADLLRHGCHTAALGVDKSSDNLDNRDLDLVLALFDLLIDPLNLAARMRLDNPGLDARRRLEWAVEHCGLPEAYVLTVCASKFGTHAWRNLEDVQLRQLMVTLKGRVKARREAMPEPAGAAAENRPF